MMKVLQINDSDEFQKLQLRDKRYVYQVMDDFFKKYPKEYRRNYDRNLSETSLLLVDELGEQVRAEYYADVDKIAYSDSDYIVHELMHMAHYDRDKDIMAIEQKNNTMGDSLIEGAAEYLASQAMGVANDGYIFQTFVIDMLSDIENFFEPFFIPNYKKFIRLSLVKEVRPIKNEKIVRYKDLTTGNIIKLGNYTYEREKEFIDDSFGLIPYNEIVVNNKSNNKKLSKKID